LAAPQTYAKVLPLNARSVTSGTISGTVIWDMGGIMYRFFTELMVDAGKAKYWLRQRMPMGPAGQV